MIFFHTGRCNLTTELNDNAVKLSARSQPAAENSNFCISVTKVDSALCACLFEENGMRSFFCLCPKTLLRYFYHMTRKVLFSKDVMKINKPKVPHRNFTLLYLNDFGAGLQRLDNQLSSWCVEDSVWVRTPGHRIYRGSFKMYRTEAYRGLGVICQLKKQQIRL